MKSKSRWVIGRHACEEALRSHKDWVLEASLLDGKAPKTFADQLKAQGIKFKLQGPKFFNQLGEGHQGMALRMGERPRWQESQLSESGPSLIAFLDGLTDPHNLGAVLRSAWLLGVEALFIPKDRAVDLNATVAKVACGGAEHVPVESCHFGSQLAWFKEHGFWVYGLSEKAGQTLPETQLSQRSVLVLGAEGSGLRRSTLSLCDALVSLPQVSQGPSFNASVAFALSAYEWRRQTHDMAQGPPRFSD